MNQNRNSRRRREKTTNHCFSEGNRNSRRKDLFDQRYPRRKKNILELLRKAIAHELPKSETISTDIIVMKPEEIVPKKTIRKIKKRRGQESVSTEEVEEVREFPEITPEVADYVEDLPAEVRVVETITQEGNPKKTTIRKLKRRKGSKEERTARVTVEELGRKPETTVSIEEIELPEEIERLPDIKYEESRYVEELRVEIQVTETVTKEGKPKKTIVKKIRRRRVGKVEETQVTRVEEEGKKPEITVLVEEISEDLPETLVTEILVLETITKEDKPKKTITKKMRNINMVKRRLLMREAALQKRRKDAEELLRCHRKLLDEEKKIAELEAEAVSVVAKIPATEKTSTHKYKFTGKQLNQLWYNMTGRDERKYSEEKIFTMPQSALERLCKSARQYSNKHKKKTSDDTIAESESDRKNSVIEEYSSVFEPESVQDDEKTNISSISELIDNFSRIESEISSLSKKTEESTSKSSTQESVKTVTPNHFEDKISEEITSPQIEDKIITIEEIPSNIVVTTESQNESDEIVDEVISPEQESEDIPESGDKIPSQTSVSSLQLQTEEKEESVVSVTQEQGKSIANTTQEGESVTSEEKIECEEEEEVVEEIPSISKESLEEALEAAYKIEESLIRINDQLGSSSSDKIETLAEEISKEDGELSSSSSSSKSSPKSSTSPPGKIDVKKRVSEILADANGHRGDKSPRVQDLYVTAYDVGSAASESVDSPQEEGRQMPTDIFGTEAEELWKKQLAIEQEIKQLEQQQKEQLPYVFMREIPNKPPPPYTPPSSLSLQQQSVLPVTVKEVNEVVEYSSKVLYKAYLNKNLDKVKFSENGFKLYSKVEVATVCAEFVFNVCRDVTRNLYKSAEQVDQPVWLIVNKKPQLSSKKPPDGAGLERILNMKLRELLGFKKAEVAESAIVKWARKKRDHVDEIIVQESQEEETQWIHFEQDELVVKDRITGEIMKKLIDETVAEFVKVMSKKKAVVS